MPQEFEMLFRQRLTPPTIAYMISRYVRHTTDNFLRLTRSCYRFATAGFLITSVVFQSRPLCALVHSFQ
jgi:hypothetical protein